jgi:AraC-like DNA-binding protein
MITINSKLKSINSFFENLQNNIGGTLTSTPRENTLHIDAKVGKGSIRSIVLEDGISLLEFSLVVSQDIKIDIDSEIKPYVNFVYCSKGKLSHAFSRSESLNTIETFQTGIISNVSSEKNTIFLSKDVQTNATIISVNTENSGKSSTISSALKEAFIENKQDDYIYLSSYNLKIAENIKQLKSIENEGVVRALLTKGIINMILGLEINQYHQDLKQEENTSGSLSNREMTLIQELSDYINNYPELNHKICNLTKKIGLTAAKIQEGIKMMHGLTVCEYIRSVRLKKSEEMILNSDLNISEIVYSLGFSSRSYFSKKFREKYNCSPSKYSKKNKLAVSA